MKLTSKLLIVVLFSLLVLTSCKYIQKDEIETIIEPEQITGVGDGTVKFAIQSSDGTDLFYVSNDGNAEFKYNLTVGDNLTVGEDIYIGDSEGDSYIYFYEDGSPTGESFYWANGEDRFKLSNYLSAQQILTTQLISTGDIYTTGVNDDLFLGDSIQADAKFRAYADGSLEIADNKFNVSTAGLLTTAANIEIDSTNKVCLNGDTCTQWVFANSTGIYIVYASVERIKINSTHTVIS